MTDSPLLLGIPSKGRLQENCAAFFGRAGMRFVQERGARDYRGAVAGMDDVEVLFLSASEIAGQLASGAIHMGVTGEDLVRETIPRADERVLMIEPLGFGQANVVVAVPQAWIDVRGMMDVEDVAASFRQRHGRRLRVATKYVNLTRGFFSGHGVADYLIVESLGATEGAPASGAADLIVDITTTGATLAANALKVLEDGIILRSEANLVGSLSAPWGARARAGAAAVLARIAAQARAAATREVRCALAEADEPLLADLAGRFGAGAPFGPPAAGQPLTLHAPAATIYALADWLAARGAHTISVSTLDFVFEPENALMQKLEAGLGPTPAADGARAG
ncbi:ATP phosphoribosyltransferase [Labrys wisconsinensis]|uniref:ATP phosphoribosyltransferase n=1 Tax=Labrys wisconsinensis TaxID=425677 RepID=A0ABU0JL26_9HYPH|nr:ATP phosphoribosyltransferase [Labrys wisconsinensis]MDQ0474996.1 ATP phosphoribosyltransferase [Labrys wisconsinensis]